MYFNRMYTMSLFAINAMKVFPSEKTFDAKKFEFMVVQTAGPLKDISEKPQSENCLTLNIWTRGEDTNKPAMVFIPGER